MNYGHAFVIQKKGGRDELNNIEKGKRNGEGKRVGRGRDDINPETCMSQL